MSTQQEIKCEKATTPAGQEQRWSLYVLVDAVNEQGQSIKVRQSISPVTTLSQLQGMATVAQQRIDAIQAEATKS